MRGGALRRFYVHVPGEQKGGAINRWALRAPPFIRSWDRQYPEYQVGAGIKDMVKDVARETGRGLKRTFTQRSLPELPRGVKRGVKRAAKHEVKRRVSRKLDDIFAD